jgi:putative transposase
VPNTFTSLHYHIVFGTKQRTSFLRGAFLDEMHHYLGGAVRALDGIAIRVGGVEDHVHLLVWLKATHSLPDVLGKIKKGSSDWAGRQRRDFYWQDGYSAFTVGRRELSGLENYIAGQEEHHRRKTFEEEYRELLIEHDIRFDERYLL